MFGATTRIESLKQLINLLAIAQVSFTIDPSSYGKLVMGLFDQIAGAIANPNQVANPDQLGSIINTVQQVTSNEGVSPVATQTMVSMVGSEVRSALQEQRDIGGVDRVESIVNQVTGASADQLALQALFPLSKQRAIAQAIAQRTGLDENLILSLLPRIVPIVLKFLNMGRTTQATQQGTTSGNSNNVLNAFLDADNDGDVDLGDTMMMASRYLGQNR